jgi:hypothetical protein
MRQPAAASAYALALWRTPEWAHTHDPGDRHDVRALVVSAGAAVVAIGLHRRTYRLSHRGQVTDQFTKALERLSSPDIDARLGGIYTRAARRRRLPAARGRCRRGPGGVHPPPPAATRPARLWPHDPPNARPRRSAPGQRAPFRPQLQRHQLANTRLGVELYDCERLLLLLRQHLHREFTVIDQTRRKPPFKNPTTAMSRTRRIGHKKISRR